VEHQAGLAARASERLAGRGQARLVAGRQADRGKRQGVVHPVRDGGAAQRAAVAPQEAVIP
jgi:hypothetical protein